MWLGSDGANDQVFRAKLVTKPSIARSPSKSSLTYKRKKGVARYTLAATVRDKDGTRVEGKRVYLQTSRNGKTWKNTYKLATSATGRVSKSFKSRTTGTRYYRWYVSASPEYVKAYTSKQRVRVK